MIGDVGQTVRFGSYELRALLGQGGMAKVYRAVRVGPHGFAKEVALKVLHPHATSTSDQVGQLTDEARVGGMLRHPNIVATDELGQVGPCYYIAMELVEGWPLDRLLRQHRLDERSVPRPVVLDLLIGIARALEYVHDLKGRDGAPLKLVHRDMKPANVMIGRSGQVKIMDFGIAKATTNLYTTQERSTRGTPLFMSPEQVAGSELDGRSDLFSVGSMLQEIVTLDKTFAGEELIPILRAVLEVDIDEATERLRTAWPEILPVFLRCMQPNPADRYPNAAELRRDLEALRASTDGPETVLSWASSFADLLPMPPDGELGELLHGVIVVVTDPDRGTDTISMPMQAVNEVESQFEMPLGPSAGPTRGRPTTSEDSINSLRWDASDGPPKMPGWLASATFMQPDPEPAPSAREGFVKPGRPLAPRLDQVSPPKPQPIVVPPSPSEIPSLPPGHPLFRRPGADPAPAGPVQLPRARPEARPLSRPAAAVPRAPGRPLSRPGSPVPSRPGTAPGRTIPIGPARAGHQPGERLPLGRRLGGSVLRITLALAVFAALVHSYSFVPGPVGDIARSIMDAARTVLGFLGGPFGASG
jgi:serine/threonine protein kinase